MMQQNEQHGLHATYTTKLRIVWEAKETRQYFSRGCILTLMICQLAPITSDWIGFYSGEEPKQ